MGEGSVLAKRCPEAQWERTQQTPASQGETKPFYIMDTQEGMAGSKSQREKKSKGGETQWLPSHFITTSLVYPPMYFKVALFCDFVL